MSQVRQLLAETETLTLEVYTFIYQTSRTEINFRVVGDISEVDGYLQSIDPVKGELRTLGMDRILERIEPASNEAGVMARLNSWKSISTDPIRRPRPEVEELTVCFTGFKAADKVALASLAENVTRRNGSLAQTAIQE